MPAVGDPVKYPYPQRRHQMKGLRTSYVAAILIAFCLNGWALLQHLAVVPGHDGFIAAVLIANMLCVPFALWAAFIFGEVEEVQHTAHRRLR
jgi:hypothetical protein